jgi:hypothetical protein
MSNSTSEQEQVSEFQNLFGKAFLGQLNLIITLQALCLNSSDQRDHDNLQAAISGYDVLTASVRASSEGSVFLANRNNN